MAIFLKFQLEEQVVPEVLEVNTRTLPITVTKEKRAVLMLVLSVATISIHKLSNRFRHSCKTLVSQ